MLVNWGLLAALFILVFVHAYKLGILRIEMKVLEERHRLLCERHNRLFREYVAIKGEADENS